MFVRTGYDIGTPGAIIVPGEPDEGQMLEGRAKTRPGYMIIKNHIF
jgi:hypothetical protein